jgi:ankyrin repeat protein
VRVGDLRLVAYVIKDLYQLSHYGFNELHYLALGQYKKGAKLPEFKSVSVAKKATCNLGITPLHFACINPNVEVLTQLLDVNPDFNMGDNEMRRPIHYAAACES